jgi:hypothetical protein
MMLFSALFIFFTFGILISSLIFATHTYAENYSPSDFHLKTFEIQAGIDKKNGRYYTYHYEFDE